MVDPVVEFMRYTAPDAEAHARGVAALRDQLECALRVGDNLAITDHAADLASLLTTDRQEAAALQLLREHLAKAEALPGEEPAGWFWNAYATALQYNGLRAEANPAFARALELARAGGWVRLQSFVLQHWGRSLVEQGDLDQAQSKFEEALGIRRQLSDTRTATTERALAALDELREQRASADAALLHGACHCGAVRLTLPSLPEKATRCNCSLCRRLGGLWAYYEFGTVKVEGHPEHTTEYIWGDKTLRTVRCAHCGCATHWEPLVPEAGARHGVNLNNFDPQLVAAVQVRRFDGADSWTFLD